MNDNETLSEQIRSVVNASGVDTKLCVRMLEMSSPEKVRTATDLAKCYALSRTEFARKCMAEAFRRFALKTATVHVARRIKDGRANFVEPRV